MNISFLKKLIELVESSEIEELEIKRWWTTIRITKRVGHTQPRGEQVKERERVITAEANPQPQAPAETEKAENIVEIKSPMVGTFYRAPSPGAKPYVEVGDRVEPGQVVCIIEAMKLMNEIESEVSGVITKVLVENAQPVEYGQPLFLVSTS